MIHRDRAAPVRWGIIGCGDVTEVKSAPAYTQVEGFRLDAVMSRTAEKVKDYAARHHIGRWYTDANALIADPDLDAIYIATPPDSHHEYALMVADAGKICCVEKPMAQSYAQCVAMRDAFIRQQLPLFVAYYRRCLPSFRQLKALLEQGVLGDVLHVDWQYRRPPSQRDVSGCDNWRTDANIAPGGYFDDIACHGLDVLCYLLGDVHQAKGVQSNQQGHYTALDAISASWQFNSDATATGAWHFNSFDKRDEVTLVGTKGTLSFGVFSESPAILITAAGSQRLPMPKPTPIQYHFVEAMAAQLFDGIPHPSTGGTAAHTHWLMEQILTP